jgi:ribonuclease HI
MRVFTDGSCSHNGKKDAKAGFAVWFPEHKELSMKEKLPSTEPQTNQRAELRAIHKAIHILDQGGFHDEDILIYTDSDYSINCLTKWIPGWVSRGWKTAEGKDVLHQDLIREASALLSKFRSHRFHHVRAHTGNTDDISKNNDIVDRMARSTIDESVVEIPTVSDELFEGCPLRLLGPPIPQTSLLTWMRSNISTLDEAVVNKHLIKAFTEICKQREVNITNKRGILRAERGHLQIEQLTIVKADEH